ncbi:MAG TPA: hypothetical protein VK388_13785 [Pyrinomonadaceae bacterium]|nr:hypothetical protein [Pyrinomonadaceae bacterium]
MNRMLTAGAAICLLLALSVQGQAQYRRGRIDTRAEVERTIRRVENASDRFVRSFDNSLDRSRLDGRAREDRLNERAAELERELDILRQEFDRTDRYHDTRAQVSRVLSTAQGLNAGVMRRRFASNTEQHWAVVRRELNSLAEYYNLRGLR